MSGSRLATTVETVITLGRRRRSAPSVTASRAPPVSTAPQFLAFARHSLFQIDHHDHGRLHRRTKRAMKPTQTATDMLYPRAYRR